MLSELLQHETERLIKLKINFYIYEMGFPGKVGIVVEKGSKDYAINIKQITVAGYAYAGDYPKRDEYELYTISLNDLRKILKIEE